MKVRREKEEEGKKERLQEKNTTKKINKTTKQNKKIDKNKQKIMGGGQTLWQPSLNREKKVKELN